MRFFVVFSSSFYTDFFLRTPFLVKFRYAVFFCVVQKIFVNIEEKFQFDFICGGGSIRFIGVGRGTGSMIIFKFLMKMLYRTTNKRRESIVYRTNRILEV